MSSLIDKNMYQKADLVEVKIPLNLPYFNDWQDYESFDGEVELNHVLHRYVMRKIARDTLFLLCLPDYNKTKLSEAKTNYIGYVNENGKGQNENSHGKSTGKKTILTDEFQLSSSHANSNAFNLNHPLQYNLFKRSLFLNHTLTVPGKPPEIPSLVIAA